jgi:hypothetical protein
MWAANSSFIPTSNGEPMFTNLYCGATAVDEAGNQMGEEFSGIKKPSYRANESCSILKDNPDQLTWDEEPWVNFRSEGKTFDVPGISGDDKEGVVKLQPLEMRCEVLASTPTKYTAAIRDSDGNTLSFVNGTTGKDTDVCSISIENIEPGERYQVVFFSAEDGK